MKNAETNKLKKLLHQLVVVRDKKCLHCGATKNLHASHIKPKGLHPHIQWNPRNLKALCFYCHLMWWHKDATDAGEWYKKKYPKNLTYLNSIVKRKKDMKYKHKDYEYNHKILTKEIPK